MFAPLGVAWRLPEGLVCLSWLTQSAAGHGDIAAIPGQKGLRQQGELRDICRPMGAWVQRSKAEKYNRTSKALRGSRREAVRAIMTSESSCVYGRTGEENTHTHKQREEASATIVRIDDGPVKQSREFSGKQSSSIYGQLIFNKDSETM